MNIDNNHVLVSQENKILKFELFVLSSELENQKREYEEILNSKSWKITKPLRWLNRIAKEPYRIFQTNNEVKQKDEQYFPYGIIPFRNTDVKRIDIITREITLSAAKALCNHLNDIGIVSCLSVGVPPQLFNIPYIVFTPQLFDNLPKRFAIYQMEQMIQPKWKESWYIDLLKQSEAIINYSMINKIIIDRIPELTSKNYYFPIECNRKMLSCTEYVPEKEYDILFYGALNERRQNILSSLMSCYNVKILDGIWGDEAYEEIKKAKIVVNLHYYENATLETNRLYELLSLGNNIIISERSIDTFEDNRLQGIIDFVEIGDIDGLKEQINYWLSDDSRREMRVISIRQIMLEQNSQDDSSFRDLVMTLFEENNGY